MAEMEVAIRTGRKAKDGRHVQPNFVMPGHSRSKNGVASARLCPRHPHLASCSARLLVIWSKSSHFECFVGCHIRLFHFDPQTRKTWMAGTSPAMTTGKEPTHRNDR